MIWGVAFPLLAALAPLPCPEYLAPRDVPCLVRGAPLEDFRSHLEALLASHPSGLADALRLRLGPALNQPHLLAADGTRPWAVALEGGTRAVWMIPVEDEAAFREAAAASLPGMRIRFERGYALMSRDEAFLARFGEEEGAERQDPLPGTSDLKLRLRLPEGLDFLPETLRKWASDLDAVEAGLTLRPDGLSASALLKPRRDSDLETRLETLEPQRARWLGLAPPGAALAAELHGEAKTFAWLMTLAGIRGGAFPVLEEMGVEAAALTAFRSGDAWAGQLVCRCRSEVRLPRLRESLGDGFEAWGVPVHAGEPSADEAAGTLSVELLRKETQFSVHASLAGRLLVAAAGPDAAARVAATASALRQGPEPGLTPEDAALLKALPERVNAVVLLSPAQLAGARPGAPDRFAASLTGLQGEGALVRVEIPGSSLAALYAFWQKKGECP